MLFSKRSTPAGPVKTYSHSDLIQCVQYLLRNVREAENKSKTKSSYSWLRSRSPAREDDKRLEEFKPLIYKMSPESCIIVSVTLTAVTEDANLTSDGLLAALRSLLDEQYRIQMLEEYVRRVKEKRRLGGRSGRVLPEVGIQEGKPAVSFISM